MLLKCQELNIIKNRINITKNNHEPTMWWYEISYLLLATFNCILSTNEKITQEVALGIKMLIIR